MNFDYLNVIGLMTGTSMDGIDISLVSTNGVDLKTQKQNHFYKFSNETRKILLNIKKQNVEENFKKKKFLDDLVTEEHYKALVKTDLVNKCDLIGFHGQTIYHNPNKKKSIQLGNPRTLAKLLNKDVVSDFRSKDLSLGGQGAPLAPIYHKFLIKKLKLELPSCIVNIGGISNLTYWDGNKLIGFDTGPGNALMDHYMFNTFDEFFDKDGHTASRGAPIKTHIEKFLKNEFFKINPPKSLDKQAFILDYNKIVLNNYSRYDIMATLCEFTVQSILKSIKILPKKIKSILITGGGHRNIHLMDRLYKVLGLELYNEKNSGIKFDYIEAELIAYLTARSIYKLPLTFPSTTGVSKPVSGGRLYKCL